ncbi:MAG: carboxypeptidase-like regulatory domain-containing protein [Flavobacteriales bacterium]|nr:carboxypeptidase-like regulatory domain-containing protein [Flavobacteriales bacterium]
MTKTNGFLMYKLFLSTVLLFLLAGCDCLQTLKGTVVDATTGNPLSNAIVYKELDNSIRDTTDAQGMFEISDITSTKDCNNIKLIAERSGYNTLALTAPNGADIIIKLSN